MRNTQLNDDITSSLKQVEKKENLHYIIIFLSMCLPMAVAERK